MMMMIMTTTTIEFFIYLCAKLNSQLPITESAWIQSNNKDQTYEVKGETIPVTSREGP
jgi:hypothetical protein